MNKKIRLIFTLLLTVTISLSNMYLLPVKADSFVEYKAEPVSITIYGYDYTYYSYLVVSFYDNAEGASARTRINVNKPAPAGYYGQQSRLYNRAGALIYANDWDYNYNPNTVGMDYPTKRTLEKGVYYSKGVVEMYNGRGYNTYINNQSPFGNVRSLMNNDAESFSVSDKGESYGSALNSINEPDFILAQGVKGKTGYIKKSDLNKGKASTLAEAVIKSAGSKLELIPLYESDGVTIIDTFMLSAGEIE